PGSGGGKNGALAQSDYHGRLLISGRSVPADVLSGPACDRIRHVSNVLREPARRGEGESLSWGTGRGRDLRRIRAVRPYEPGACAPVLVRRAQFRGPRALSGGGRQPGTSTEGRPESSAHLECQRNPRKLGGP